MFIYYDELIRQGMCDKIYAEMLSLIKCQNDDETSNYVIEKSF